MRTKRVEIGQLSKDVIGHVNRMNLSYKSCKNCSQEQGVAKGSTCQHCGGEILQYVDMDEHIDNGGVVIYRADVFPAIVYAGEHWYPLDVPNKITADYGDLGDYSEAVDWARSPVQLDPLNESRKAAVLVIHEGLVEPLIKSFGEALFSPVNIEDQLARQDRGRIMMAKLVAVQIYHAWLYKQEVVK